MTNEKNIMGRMIDELSIVDALKTARKSQGLTQAELANCAGTTRVTVGRIEAGLDPKLSTVYELARALGLTITLVPKSLASEVQAFLVSGGRTLAQPAGASAPPSVVDMATVVRTRPPLKAAESVPEPTTQMRLFAKPQNPQSLAKRTGKPTISPSAAKALGLQSPPKTGKPHRTTQINP